MQASKKSLAIPILIMAIGAAWLLNTIGVIPGVDWIWTVGLGTLGILILAFGGWNKVSVVVGAFLLIASVFSVARQTGRLNPQIEVPSLVIVFGVLLLFVQLSNLPMPEALKEEKKTK